MKTLITYLYYTSTSCDMVIGLETPSNPYTISGSKYKDKFYDSDVEIIPAEGYKITTSKDKEPTDKLKITKTTKDLKIYLVKVRNIIQEI